MNVYQNIVNGKYENTIIRSAKTIKEYFEEKNLLQSSFKNDLFIQFDVVDNPRNEKCYQLAWEYGHSSGFYEVYNCFVDLVELIK